MSTGFKLISRAERYEDDPRKSIPTEEDTIELDYVTKYKIDLATPRTSLAKSYEIKNDLIITMEIPKSDYKNENFQKLLGWSQLPVQHDDYYRDLAVNYKIGGDNYKTVLFSHARITTRIHTNTEADYVTAEIYAKQKEDQFVGVVMGTDLDSTYAKAREKVANPKLLNIVSVSAVEYIKRPTKRREAIQYWVENALLINSRIDIYSGGSVNLRREPSEPSQVLTSIPMNTRLNVMQAKDSGGRTWYNVKYQTYTGWAVNETSSGTTLLCPVASLDNIVKLGLNDTTAIRKAPGGATYPQLTGLDSVNDAAVLENGDIVTIYQPFEKEIVSGKEWLRISAWKKGNMVENVSDAEVSENSPLVEYTQISPNSTNPRNHAIDTITIHCMAGNLSIETCGDVFAPSSASASSNYGIGTDGRVGMYVEEKNRSWCSSSTSNDHRAVTIEVANNGGEPDWPVSDKAYSALLDLVTDICKRNNIKKLLWKADKNLIGQIEKQNMTVHRWFAAKACPGDYLYNLHYDIAEKVNSRL